MDEGIATKGLVITGIIYLSISVPIGFLALGCLFSYPDSVWLLGLIWSVIASATLLFYSGIKDIRNQNKRKGESAAYPC